MKSQLLALLKITNPKKISQVVKRDKLLFEWVLSGHGSTISEKIYNLTATALVSCSYGKQKKFKSLTEGYVGCGPASTCQCTKDSISKNVSLTKQKISQFDAIQTNSRRSATMLAKYGVEFNSQRLEIKKILQNPKIPIEAYLKLTNYDWLHTEYIVNQRTLVDIADELGIYYSTVAEYCKKFGFVIRQVTNYSVQEREIEHLLTTFDIKCITNDWQTLHTQEIDILIPSYSIGIEVDGLYWHSFHPSNRKQEDKNRHLSKSKLASLAGIDVIHITDYEWNQKTQVITNILKSKLKLNSTVFARKCSISTVTKQVEKQFLKENHLQGFVPSAHAYGLFSNNVLLMLISLGKSRYEKSVTFEILRVCSAPGITVVGGLSKLISHVKKSHPNSSFITYCDLSKSNGNSYTKAGLTFVKDTNPGYFWTDGTSVISRYKCQKKQLAKWLPSFNPLLSESENLFNAKYRRFWDCGNRVFTFSS